MPVCLDLKSKTPLLKFTDDEVVKILEQYDRKPNALDEDILIIRKWLNDQKHFPYELTDRKIFGFLLMNKFSFEATKEKIDMMFTIRSFIPEFYQFSQNSSTIENVSKACCHCPMPNLTKRLNRLYVSTCFDPCLIDSFIPIYSLILQIMEIRNDYDISNSDEYIIDMQNVSVKMVTLAAPMDIKKILTVAEKVFSNRIAAIHIVNMPTYAETIIGIFKVLLKPKLRERLHFHRDASTLLDFYPKELLPKEYGGEGQSLLEIKDNWRKFMLEHNDYLENMMKARVNESLRSTKLDNDEILGFHGNFRQLQFD